MVANFGIADDSGVSLSDFRSSSLDVLVLGGIRREAGTQPGVEITIAERLLERCESGLASAVAGCHELHSKRVMQGHNNFLDVRIVCHCEVKSARDHVDAGVDRAGFFDDLVDARM